MTVSKSVTVYKLQRPAPDLESCRLKLCSDCLSLSIVLLYKNMQPFERDRQELCVMRNKRGTLQLRCSKSQNVDWEKVVVRKVCWPRPAFSAHAYWERVQDEIFVYCI